MFALACLATDFKFRLFSYLRHADDHEIQPIPRVS